MHSVSAVSETEVENVMGGLNLKKIVKEIEVKSSIRALLSSKRVQRESHKTFGLAAAYPEQIVALPLQDRSMEVDE